MIDKYADVRKEIVALRDEVTTPWVRDNLTGQIAWLDACTAKLREVKKRRDKIEHMMERLDGKMTNDDRRRFGTMLNNNDSDRCRWERNIEHIVNYVAKLYTKRPGVVYVEEEE